VIESGNNAARDFTIVAATGPIVAKNELYAHAPSYGIGGYAMQTKRTYQVQHWRNGQWDRERNWQKVEAGSEREAAEKVCGRPLAEAGKLVQLRARVLTLGDLKQRSATPFYASE
jgi:hypothetical protein